MIVAIGSDHAGYENPPPYYKPAIMGYVEQLGYGVVDCGAAGPDATDYPDIADRVCAEIRAGRTQTGILLCGTGMGISMAANRHPGIRAAVCLSPEMVHLARAHNDANVLCIGRRVLSLEECLALVDAWFATPFDGGERHQRRIAKMG